MGNGVKSVDDPQTRPTDTNTSSFNDELIRYFTGELDMINESIERDSVQPFVNSDQVDTSFLMDFSETSQHSVTPENVLVSESETAQIGGNILGDLSPTTALNEKFDDAIRDINIFCSVPDGNNEMDESVSDMDIDFDLDYFENISSPYLEALESVDVCEDELVQNDHYRPGSSSSRGSKQPGVHPSRSEVNAQTEASAPNISDIDGVLNSLRTAPHENNDTDEHESVGPFVDFSVLQNSPQPSSHTELLEGVVRENKLARCDLNRAGHSSSSGVLSPRSEVTAESEVSIDNIYDVLNNLNIVPQVNNYTDESETVGPVVDFDEFSRRILEDTSQISPHSEALERVELPQINNNMGFDAFYRVFLEDISQISQHSEALERVVRENQVRQRDPNRPESSSSRGNEQLGVLPSRREVTAQTEVSASNISDIDGVLNSLRTAPHENNDTVESESRESFMDIDEIEPSLFEDISPSQFSESLERVFVRENKLARSNPNRPASSSSSGNERLGVHPSRSEENAQTEASAANISDIDGVLNSLGTAPHGNDDTSERESEVPGLDFGAIDFSVLQDSPQPSPHTEVLEGVVVHELGRSDSNRAGPSSSSGNERLGVLSPRSEVTAESEDSIDNIYDVLNFNIAPQLDNNTGESESVGPVVDVAEFDTSFLENSSEPSSFSESLERVFVRENELAQSDPNRPESSSSSGKKCLGVRTSRSELNAQTDASANIISYIDDVLNSLRTSPHVNNDTDEGESVGPVEDMDAIDASDLQDSLQPSPRTEVLERVVVRDMELARSDPNRPGPSSSRENELVGVHPSRSEVTAQTQITAANISDIDYVLNSLRTPPHSNTDEGESVGPVEDLDVIDASVLQDSSQPSPRTEVLERVDVRENELVRSDPNRPGPSSSRENERLGVHPSRSEVTAQTQITAADISDIDGVLNSLRTVPHTDEGESVGPVEDSDVIDDSDLQDSSQPSPRTEVLERVVVRENELARSDPNRPGPSSSSGNESLGVLSPRIEVTAETEARIDNIYDILDNLNIPPQVNNDTDESESVGPVVDVAEFDTNFLENSSEPTSSSEALNRLFAPGNELAQTERNSELTETVERKCTERTILDFDDLDTTVMESSSQTSPQTLTRHNSLESLSSIRNKESGDEVISVSQMNDLDVSAIVDELSETVSDLPEENTNQELTITVCKRDYGGSGFCRRRSNRCLGQCICGDLPLDTTSDTDVYQRGFRCVLCNKIFLSIEPCRAHVRDHIENPYRCEKCNTVFKYLMSLKHHMNYHHKDAPLYKCEFCDTPQLSEVLLNKHKRYHLGIGVFKCEFCHRVYKNYRALGSHVGAHKLEKSLNEISYIKVF